MQTGNDANANISFQSTFNPPAEVDWLNADSIRFVFFLICSADTIECAFNVQCRQALKLHPFLNKCKFSFVKMDFTETTFICLRQ